MDACVRTCERASVHMHVHAHICTTRVLNQIVTTQWLVVNAGILGKKSCGEIYSRTVAR